MATFYESMPQLRAKMEGISPDTRMECKTGEEFLLWKESARAKLRLLLGMDKCVWAAPQPEMLTAEPMDGYTRQKWIIRTEPEVIMPFYVLVPDGIPAGEKRPAVIATHGHGSFGKEAVAGNRLFPELSKSIDENNYDYGVQAVRRGYLVFCPDARGFGERREQPWQGDDPGSKLGSSCVYINNMAISLGMSLAGLWTWDLMRLMDYLLSRDDVLGEKVGVIGLSGGGLQSLYFSAMDDRLAFTAVAGYFYGFKESLLEMHNCACNYVPHLWEHFDVGDIACLIAPKPLVIVTGDVDPLNGRSGLDNVKPYAAQVRSAYALCGKEENFTHDIFKGPHMWNGEVAFEKLDKVLKG